MVDNNFYLRRVIKIFMIFISVIVVISLIFVGINNITNPKKETKKPIADNSIKNNETTENNHQLDKISEDNIKKDLANKSDLEIDNREDINEWSIIVVSPKDKNLEPALLIYKKTGDSYKRIIGPGTSFTKEYMQFVGIPENIIYNDKVKVYVSE